MSIFGVTCERIETAPKDGTQILGYGNSEFCIARWAKIPTNLAGGAWIDDHNQVFKLTHWKPLDPPNED